VIRELYPKAKLITIFAKPKVRRWWMTRGQHSAGHWIEQPWDMALSFVPPLCDETEE
jgi:xanthine phosphoribosyltransferase